jgi:hypothetical protein
MKYLELALRFMAAWIWQNCFDRRKKGGKKNES